MPRHALAGALALACLIAPAIIAPAFADEAPSRCIDVSVPKGAIAAHDGKWIALTSEQFQFIRGVYVLDLQTPAGLPYGDRAALAKIDGHDGGMIFFIDGDKACTPMPIPKELVDMLDDVAAGVVRHEDGAL